jgi:hypothetical protein
MLLALVRADVLLQAVSLRLRQKLEDNKLANSDAESLYIP